MNKNDWQNAFGPVPDAFREQVNDTLMRLEEREMRKRTKFSAALIAALLAITLLTGAAFAAAQLNIWKALDSACPILPLEGADELVATDLAAAETDCFRVIVQEGVYDGYGAIVKLHIEPKDPERYAVITDFAMAGDLGDQYIAEVVEDENGMRYERIVGRKDGKEIIFLSTPSLSVDNEIADADSFGADHMFNSFRDQYNEDGSADFWINGMFVYNLPDTLNVSLRVRGMDADHNTAYGSIENLAFDLVKNNKERTVRLTPAESGKIEGFELVDATITFTEVRGYIAVEYVDSTKDRDMGVSLRLLDKNGNEITTGGGQCTELDNGHYRWEMEMQSFEEIPEAMILEARIIGDSAIGRIECKVEEISG